VAAVLFTCVGMRVDIVSAFRRAGAVTIAADASPLAPALYAADAYALVPPVDDPAYLPRLRELVAEHDVGLVVPLTDLDQQLLADRRDTLGALLLLSPAPVVAAMADKYRASAFLGERAIASPPTWLPGEVPDDAPYPLLVKARAGFGSRHIYRAHDRAELAFFLRYTSVDSMVQACCRGEEFSIDVLCDFEGRCLNAIPRTMIQSKGGESIKGMTIKDWELIEFARAVAEALPLWGPANIQCFREPGGRLEVTDVNPRFGGGFPLPLAAGSRYPELALALANGERPEPRVGEFRAGVVMARFLSEVCLVAASDGTLESLGQPAPAAAEG
jgi:carbamoyl-phosphate synthase large subunit